MTRSTKFVIETRGGSPVFHIPFPLSFFEVAPENVEFVFRNIGGRPTFHVGGAEVGVSLEDAQDYATAVEAVLLARAKGDDQVSIKVEETSPRIVPYKTPRPYNAKGKERETARVAGTNLQTQSPSDQRLHKQRKRAQRVSASTSAQTKNLNNESGPHFAPPVSPPSRRISLEETHVHRPTPASGLHRSRDQRRREFALLSDPELPEDRIFAADEEEEFDAAWQKILRMRSGPLQDKVPLEELEENIIKEALRHLLERRQHARSMHEATRPTPMEYVPSSNPNSYDFDMEMRALPDHDDPPARPAAASQESASSKVDEIVANTRDVFKPIHQAMLARGPGLRGSQDSHGASPASSRRVSGSSSKGPGSAEDPRRRSAQAQTAAEYAAWLRGTGGTPRALRRTRKENADARDPVVAGSKRSFVNVSEEEHVEAGAAKRAKHASLPPPQTGTMDLGVRGDEDEDDGAAGAVERHKLASLPPPRISTRVEGRLSRAEEEEEEEDAGGAGPGAVPSKRLSGAEEEEVVVDDDVAGGAEAAKHATEPSPPTRTKDRADAPSGSGFGPASGRGEVSVAEDSARTPGRDDSAVDKDGQRAKLGLGGRVLPRSFSAVPPPTRLRGTSLASSRRSLTNGDAEAARAASTSAPGADPHPLRSRPTLELSIPPWTTHPAAPSAQRPPPPADAHTMPPPPPPPPPVPVSYHRSALAFTPSFEPYHAWVSVSRASSPTDVDMGPVIVLNAAERRWLAAQGDLARLADWWRPVRWIELGARMYAYAWMGEGMGKEGEDGEREEEERVRPLHHGALLRAWDRGEWRFVGHEGVGRVGVPWSVWVRSEEGRAWREGRGR